MDRELLRGWVTHYEAAWRAPGTDALGELFAADASYVPAPYAAPIRGLEAIAHFWEEGRDGPDEVFTMTSEVLATEGDTGIARVEVRYGDPVRQEYRDLWVVVLDADRRCTTFEEWPFFPGQPLGAPGAG